ncbi:MAG: DUF4440 domain-containing protein [Candidatus Zixiibacteriota bacterium]
MADGNSLSDLLYQLETRLFQPDVRHSREQLTELIAEEFVEFGSSGCIYDRDSIIASLAEESSMRISISDFKCVALSSEVALVTYRATITEGDQPTGDSLRSSIWKIVNGNWRMVFHQGTPTAAESFIPDGKNIDS